MKIPFANIRVLALAGLLTTTLILNSCNKEQGQLPDPVTPEKNPDTPAPPDPYEYLNDYADLKSYLDSAAREGLPISRNFRLGAAIDANQFANVGSTVNRILSANFNDITAGNEMKQASILRSDGNMDFSTVKRFIEAAKSSGTTIYGHCLAWHSQQSVSYLNGLIADRIVPGDGNTRNVAFESDFSNGQPLNGWGLDHTRSVVADGPDGSNCMKISNTTTGQNYEAQCCIDYAYIGGASYTLSFKARATSAYTLSANFQNTNDNYKGCGDFSPAQLTTSWQTFESSVEAASGANRLVFSYGDFKGDIFIDDICLYTMTSGKKVPLTDEEKKAVLSEAMDRWIDGMMDACGGYVTAWDAVNEAISGGGSDGHGNYALQHGSSGDNFFWQDYLGDIDYVRTVIASARKHFEEHGGAPGDLKLFINDYNLESDWDNLSKARSMVGWIKRWEEDGVTRIDGIGSQMHISYYEDKRTQQSKERAVEEMFRILASSGKLVKISELDMGYVNSSGNTLKSASLSVDQHKQMASFYNFIVRKYFEIIPGEQQFGITFWCPADSPANSGWRAGEPTGLWTTSFTRKPAYAGVAEGIMGRVLN